jgi:hypothetical protein
MWRFLRTPGVVEVEDKEPRRGIHRCAWLPWLAIVAAIRLRSCDNDSGNYAVMAAWPTADIALFATAMSNGMVIVVNQQQ